MPGKLANTIAFFENAPISPVETLVNVGDTKVLVKRDDLLSPEPGAAFCGNKWRKLKYNLIKAVEEGHHQILTFGGAFSNHIAAVAEAGALLGINTIGVIRGGPFKVLNPTLTRAKELGMVLYFMDRRTYRQKTDTPVQEDLRSIFGSFYLIPEGGTNELALLGCAELVKEVEQQINKWPDLWILSCGTGGTMAGLINGLKGRNQVLGIPVLKGIDFGSILKEELKVDHQNWAINNNYHFGGYAKFDKHLITFMNQFKYQYDFSLDPVYTGKLFFGVLDLLEKGELGQYETVLVVHTGGLQGIAGFNQRHGGLIRT